MCRLHDEAGLLICCEFSLSWVELGPQSTQKSILIPTSESSGGSGMR